MLDYIQDKDYVEDFHFNPRPSYLSCLYYAILANGDGVEFPYFIKAYDTNNIQRLVEPTTESVYFDQHLIDTEMNIPTCSIWD